MTETIIVFKPFDAALPRGDFDCGIEVLTTWFREQSSQWRSGTVCARTWASRHLSHSLVVIGFELVLVDAIDANATITCGDRELQRAA